MQRFYLPSLTDKNNLLTLNDQRLLHQMTKVLRMKEDDFFHGFNEEAGEFLFQIESIDRKSVNAKQIKKIENSAEPRLEVSLYQALPKKPATFELIVQKVTEIGVSHIYPFVTERTQSRRLPKFERLESIAMEAAEQCGRLKIPTIHHPVDFEEVIPALSNPYMGYEFEREHYLQDYLEQMNGKKNVQIIIGPEGGFSEQEVKLAKKHKIPSFSLGPRILRMETAAMTSLGLVLLRREEN